MKNLFENFWPKKVCNPNKFCVPKKDLGPKNVMSKYIGFKQTPGKKKG